MVALGLIMHLEKKQLRHKPERVWMIYKAIRELRQKRRATPHMIEVLLGHLVSSFTLCREGLAVLDRLYAFVHRHGENKMFLLSKGELAELRRVQGLLFVCAVCDLWLPFAPTLFCSDASGRSYASAVLPTNPQESFELPRYFERWRFRRAEPLFEEKQQQRPKPWQAFEVTPTAFGLWLGKIRSRLPQKTEHVDPWRRSWRWEPTVGRVPVLQPEVTASERWHCVLRGAWKFDEAIHVKESRVEVLGLRRAARDSRLHSTRVISLCDNLSCLLAHEKRRAKSHDLLRSVQVAAAYSICANIRWFHRYCISESNPTGFDSRCHESCRICLCNRRYTLGGNPHRLRT